MFVTYFTYNLYKEPKTLFFTGAMGYIGGAVLSRVLTHHIFTSLHITALIREPSKVASFNSLGIQTVIGSYADHELLTREAEKADIVFTCANSNDPPAAKAILDGLKKRHEKTGTVAILIHTSGAGIFFQKMDELRSVVVHSDMDSDYIESLPFTQLHREVDSLNIAADKKGYVRTLTILPGFIFGVASGRIPDLGLSKKLNAALTSIINPCIERRQGAIVGSGLNIWPSIDIDDLSDLYMTIFTKALSSPSEITHGRDGHYLGTDKDTRQLDHGKAISEALVRLGAGESKEARPFDETELNSMDDFWKYVWQGSTVHARADRSFSIGWKPARDFSDFSGRYVEEIRLRLGAL